MIGLGSINGALGPLLTSTLLKSMTHPVFYAMLAVFLVFLVFLA